MSSACRVVRCLSISYRAGSNFDLFAQSTLIKSSKRLNSIFVSSSASSSWIVLRGLRSRREKRWKTSNYYPNELPLRMIAIISPKMRTRWGGGAPRGGMRWGEKIQSQKSEPNVVRVRLMIMRSAPTDGKTANRGLLSLAFRLRSCHRTTTDTKSSFHQTATSELIKNKLMLVNCVVRAVVEYTKKKPSRGKEETKRQMRDGKRKMVTVFSVY